VITLEPFLYIGIIASTRRILTTGAETAYSENLTHDQFQRYLLDVGLNVMVIVALVFAVYLARRRAPTDAAQLG
jgi:NADH:ubiquinone oxidoreductase subunit 6 (subunit J)